MYPYSQQDEKEQEHPNPSIQKGNGVLRYQDTRFTRQRFDRRSTLRTEVHAIGDKQIN